MDFLLYLRLIGFTAGTLLQLFWMVVILGFRRQRNLERVFFFLSLALFLFYSGSLLALNAQIYYATPPLALHTFALTLICTALCFLPSLLWHVHLEYAETRELSWLGFSKRATLALLYAPAFYFGLRVYPVLASGPQVDIFEPGNTLGPPYGLWMGLAFLVCGGYEIQFLRKTQVKAERVFHGAVAFFLSLAIVLAIWLHVLRSPLSAEEVAIGSAILALLAIFPMAALVYLVQRYNFLHIGRQKNLLYAVVVTSFALLYLAMVRRVSEWLAPILPPEATAAILLFILVVFFEPLQRLLGRRLQEAAQRELDRVQKLMALIQQEARQGNRAALAKFVEQKIEQEFEFEFAQLRFVSLSGAELRFAARSPKEEEELEARRKGNPTFALRRDGELFGFIRVKPHGSAISGETRAALEFLCEQLPTAIDLCRAVDEKAQLERELAERERLALVGQTAASISHNLKNPLGSIKTILQVQLESPEMPESMRGETKMVLDEISRLSGKLNQLLQFSRPAVRGSEVAATSDAASVLREVVGVLRPEADRRGIALRLDVPAQPIAVAVSAEALNDIFSNIVVNALEAVGSGGNVASSLAMGNDTCTVTVDDDGPGIPASSREKILQPFFTTKSQGTGLGLAIVARRVAECGGKLSWESPVANGRGTRFVITLPRSEERR